MQTYFLYDGLGSTTELADSAGAVTGAYTYDVFGSVRTHTGADSEWSFTGEQMDANGLLYLRARHYDPAIGRFLSRDPAVALASNPQTLNRYPYVTNNPALFIDPLGLCGWRDPWDCPVDAATWTWDESINAVGDAFSGPVATTVIQVADVVPLAEACFVVGGLAGGIAGAGAGGAGVVPGAVGGGIVGYTLCRPVEQLIGTAATYHTQIQIAKSQCGIGRKTAASAVNLANYGLDFWPFLGEVAEIAAYVATNELLGCSTGPGKE